MSKNRGKIEVVYLVVAQNPGKTVIENYQAWKKSLKYKLAQPLYTLTQWDKLFYRLAYDGRIDTTKGDDGWYSTGLPCTTQDEKEEIENAVLHYLSQAEENYASESELEKALKPAIPRITIWTIKWAGSCLSNTKTGKGKIRRINRYQKQWGRETGSQWWGLIKLGGNNDWEAENEAKSPMEEAEAATHQEYADLQ